MAILSKRLAQAMARTLRDEGGGALRFIDLQGTCIVGNDPLGGLHSSRQRRSYALQESVDRGAPFFYYAAPSVLTWVMALENQRVIAGGLLGPEVFITEDNGSRDEAAAYLAGQGMAPAAVHDWATVLLPASSRADAEAQAVRVTALFYRASGWLPELLDEKRQGLRRQQQLTEAMNEVRARGGGALYTFEKERMLLSHIRAGDRNNSRKILNEMLASIYLSAPKPVVLRARLIELLSCLTRAAIEDNPLLEPLIERNHRWTDQLIHADGFESLSMTLMQALDDFIDAVHLHGINRTNVHVHKALDYISEAYKDPISLVDVAAHVGLSACRLAHLVKAFTGNTVLEIIRQVRLRKAQELLDHSSMSCSEIAYEVGFGDQSYFIQHFKRQTGVTPMRYRRRQHAVE